MLRLAFFFVTSVTLAQMTLANPIPKILEDWQGWVLEKHKDLDCPVYFNQNSKECVWPSHLTISVNDKSGQFTQSIEVFGESWIFLPGDKQNWPLKVINLLDPKKEIVIRNNTGKPEVLLKPGKYQLQGNWEWEKMPRTLAIPQRTGIISLTIKGNNIVSPFLESQEQLLLQSSTQQQIVERQDNVQLKVFRQIADEIPIKMVTHIEMDISGKERELHLGSAMLTNFQLISFNSDLPSRLEKDGSLRVQVKSGTWKIEIESQSTQPLKEIPFPKSSYEWPPQEIWVVEHQPELRNIQISGMPSIDPEQTQLPEDWKSLPAYLAEVNSTMTIEELQRGGELAKNQINLYRTMWLDFSGNGFTLKDQITGELNESWRLETQKPYILQSVKTNDNPQVVTQLSPDSNPGVEIRQRDLELEGISRIENSFNIPISGWSSVFNEVSTTLILPPGWSLLTASGTSREYGSWIEKWTLWTFFLVLIISVAFAKIIRLWVGVTALITLIIVYHRDNAPTLIWLNFAAALALLPYISGKFKNWVQRYTYLSFVVLALCLLPFCVQQAREFFYPQQEFSDRNIRDQYYATDSGFEFFASTKKEKADIALHRPMSVSSESVEEVVVTGVRAQKNQALQKYDPNQMLQAGPGIPDWNWKSVQLTWDGPVLPEETTHLYLISPVWNRLGSLLSVLLPLFLAGKLIRHFLSIKQLDTSTKMNTNPAPSLAVILPGLLTGFLLFVGLSTSDLVKANPVIDQQLLTELENRLTTAAKCLPDCASIESVQLKAESNQLSIKMEVHALDNIAFPLPIQQTQLWPSSVLLNGNTSNLLKNSQGQLFIYLPKGLHQINIMADVYYQESINLNFVVEVHNFSNQVSGWQISGNNQNAITSVQLQRSIEENKSPQQKEQLRPDPISAFVIIKRQLQLDLDWGVTTEVIRVAPTEGVINLQVPLLEGEAPLEGNVDLQNFSSDKKSLQIKMDNQESVHWSSRLTVSSDIVLKAAVDQPWIEIWEVNVSPIWHLTTTGLNPLQPDDINQPPIWKPWPGESVTLAISRPQATKGNSAVIESASLDLYPSARASTVQLTLDILTNQANQFEFALPENSRLNEVMINQSKHFVTPIKGMLRLPLHPGKQEVKINWQSSDEISYKVSTPVVQLPLQTTNQSLNINLPSDRWPLFVGGPQMGPSVLLWGMLIVVLIVASQLGRYQLTPLKTWQWVLLSVGIATVNLYALALIALWFVTLQWRSSLTQIGSKRQFKWMQLGLFTFSIISLCTLIGTIPFSLLATPDMHIQGNGSSAHYLRWYQDISAGELAQSWVISLPIDVYKIFMLGWSLWLASSLMRWLAWSWRALGYGGFWNASDNLIRS